MCGLRMPSFASAPAMVAAPISRSASIVDCAIRSNCGICLILFFLVLCTNVWRRLYHVHHKRCMLARLSYSGVAGACKTFGKASQGGWHGVERDGKIGSPLS